jgi:hypothetical protein
MNDPIFLRTKLRVILSALPPAFPRACEEFLIAELSRVTPEPVRVPELRAAIEWNHARGLIDYRHNPMEERDEWFLTARGRQQEGLA